jgi:hypothetical protein
MGMVGHRFDTFTRAVVGSGSRRSLLHGLAGAAAVVALRWRIPHAAAQAGDLDQGDPCQFDTQCVASGTTCDYVGQSDDYRCCADEGDRCAGDEDCCGWLVCPPGDFSGSFCAAACIGAGCDCVAGAGGAISGCDDGLICCAQGEPGAPGICLTSNACYYSMAAFNPEGAPCAIAAPNACAEGLICCGEGDVGACQTAANC